jgi:hypothetical protein
MLRFSLAAAAVLLSTSAFAHASITPSTAANGATVKVAIAIPHGCDGAPTDKVTVKIPEGFVSAKPQVKAGWQITVDKADYARSYEVHGEPATNGAVSVTWAGGSVPDDQFDEFVLQGTVSADTPLAFITTQFCGAASVVWNELAAEGQNPHALKHPAPVLTVTAAEGGHDMHDMGGMDMGGMGAMDMGAMDAPAGAPVTAGDLTIAGAFTRATLPNAPVGGAYLNITNNGAADDRLVSVSTPAAGVAQIHEMKMDGDVMKMNELPDGLVIPAGQTVKLEPGGYHLMLMNLTGPLVEGQSIAVTLTFEKAGPVELQVPIGSPAAKGPEMKHSEATTLNLGDVA